MKVYAACAWNHYYPDVNNAKAIFTSRGAAEIFLDNFRFEKESIHKGYYDNYQVIELEVDEEV